MCVQQNAPSACSSSPSALDMRVRKFHPVIHVEHTVLFMDPPDDISLPVPARPTSRAWRRRCAALRGGPIVRASQALAWSSIPCTDAGRPASRGGVTSYPRLCGRQWYQGLYHAAKSAAPSSGLASIMLSRTETVRKWEFCNVCVRMGNM